MELGNPPAQSGSLDELPHACLVNILLHVGHPAGYTHHALDTIAKAAQSCRALRRAAESDLLWKVLCQRAFGARTQPHTWLHSSSTQQHQHHSLHSLNSVSQSSYREVYRLLKSYDQHVGWWRGVGDLPFGSLYHISHGPGCLEVNRMHVPKLSGGSDLVRVPLMRLSSAHPFTEIEQVGESHLLLRTNTRHPSGGGPHGHGLNSRPVSAVAEAAATTAVLLGASPPRGTFMVGSPVLTSGSKCSGAGTSQGSKKGIFGASPPRGSFLVGSPVLRSNGSSGPVMTGSGGARSSPLPVSSSSGSSAQAPKQASGSRGRPPAGPSTPEQSSVTSPAPASTQFQQPSMAAQPPGQLLSPAAGGSATHILESVVVGFTPAVVLDHAGGSSGLLQPASATAVTPPPKPGKGSKGRTSPSTPAGKASTPQGALSSTPQAAVGGTSSTASCSSTSTPQPAATQAPRSLPTALPTAATFAAEMSKFMAGQVAGPRGAARRNARRQAQVALQQEQQHHHLHQQSTEQQQLQGESQGGQVQGQGSVTAAFSHPSTSAATSSQTTPAYSAWLQGQQVHGSSSQLQALPVVPVVPIAIGGAGTSLGVPSIAAAANNGHLVTSSGSITGLHPVVISSSVNPTQAQQPQLAGAPQQQAGHNGHPSGASPQLPPARGASPPGVPRELHLVRVPVPAPSRQRPLAGLWKGVHSHLDGVDVVMLSYGHTPPLTSGPLTITGTKVVGSSRVPAGTRVLSVSAAAVGQGPPWPEEEQSLQDLARQAWLLRRAQQAASSQAVGAEPMAPQPDVSAPTVVTCHAGTGLTDWAGEGGWKPGRLWVMSNGCLWFCYALPSAAAGFHGFPGGLELEDEEEEGGLGWLHILELARVEGTP